MDRMEWYVFETLLTVAGHALDLEPHLQRLQASAARLGLPHPPLEAVREEVRGLPDAPGRLRISWPARNRPLVFWQPLDGWTRDRLTVSCVEPPHRFADAKHSDRSDWQDMLVTSGADDVLLMDEDLTIREATMAAVFSVEDGTLVTAPDDGRQLRSVGLQRVLGLCRQLGIPVTRRRPLVPPEGGALYLVSALRGIEPVVSADGKVLAPEPVGLLLQAAERSSVGLTSNQEKRLLWENM